MYCLVSDAVWSCDLDFLFESERATTSNIISQSNVTVLANLSFYVVPTPKPPVGGWTRDTTLHVAFVYLTAALLVYAVRYAAVFWFTNKVFSVIFVTQLLFMTLEAMFAHCGFEILYKLAVNYKIYEENVQIVLGSGVVILLYILAGVVMMASTFFIYTYGSHYFQEKFKIIDKRHHPEAYRKQTVIVHGSCQDYKTHTAAVVSLVILGSLKGPYLYDMVTLYRVTKDSLILTCLVIDVCYMVFWVILWTVLTLKQQWQFRILDYVPLNQPVFMISNENMIKSASYHGGSIELNPTGQKKRPSSLPSDLTASESGFGDVNSSEDERERFEISLPPLAEVPGLVNSRRKGSTHSLDRRSRNRRNGHQRVTFHETVKRSASTDSELCARNLDRRRLNIAANVHQRPSSQIGVEDRLSVEKDILRKPGSRHSIGGASQAEAPPLNNTLYHSNKQSSSYSDLGTGSDYSDRPRSINRPTPDSSIEYNDLTIKNDYAYSGARGNIKLSNHEPHINNNNVSNVSAIAQRSLAEQRAKNGTSGLTASSPIKDSYRPFINGIQKNEQGAAKNHLSPRSLEIIDNKNNQGLSRRDSANYSLTSSQETASNDSDTTQQQMLCSQV